MQDEIAQITRQLEAAQEWDCYMNPLFGNYRDQPFKEQQNG